MRFFRLPLLTALIAVFQPCFALKHPADLKNPKAVEEVLQGHRTSANVAWWGFDDEDATDAVQSAIDSRAQRVIIPYVGRDWIIRPIQLVGEQELILEKGVVLSAKRGEFRGRKDCLFTASNLSHLTLRGYGATLRMQKEDYIVGKVLADLGWNRWFGQY